MVEKKAAKAKSTPKKRAAKKAEEPKPASEIRRVVEPVKPLINWDVIGVSSASITLAGTGLLFMVGWAFESNWYQYFGVDVSLLNIAPQQYLVRSLNALMTSLAIVFLSCFLIALMKISFFQFVQLIKNKRRTPALFLSLKDWPLITVVYLIISIYFMFHQLTTSLRIMPAEIRYFGFNIYFVLWTAAFIISSYMISQCLQWIVKLPSDSKISPIKQIQEAFQKQNLLFKKINIKIWHLIYSPMALSFPAYLFLLTTLAMAAAQAVSDASQGTKLGTLYISKVYLISPVRLETLQNLNQSCNKNDFCQYGPFGLIAESSQSYYLIKWNEDKIPFHPGLFIFPRNDQNESYVIIPASVSDGQLITTPTEILDILPTFTSTTMPSLRPTITPSPVITLTPSQP